MYARYWPQIRDGAAATWYHRWALTSFADLRTDRRVQ